MWRTLTWETSLPAPECRSRLQHYSQADSVWRAFRFDAKGTVYSSVRPSSFRLFAKGPMFVRNSFEPYFYGSVLEADGRTLIRGRFRMHPVVLVFMTVWFIGVVTIGGLITAVMLYELLTGRRVSTEMAPGLAALLGPAMLAFGIGLVALGWRMGRSQREQIEQFLETALQARRLTPAFQPAPRRRRR